MQKFVRRALTTFVFSTLAFVQPSFEAKAFSFTPEFTATPNPIIAGQSSTLRLDVIVTGFLDNQDIQSVTGSITLFSGTGFSATDLFPIDINLGFFGGYIRGEQDAFLYPDPGIFSASYSFALSVVACVHNTTDCATAPIAGSGGLDLVVNPVAAQTPLPAALPLFATGLGALGLIGWWRKRKAQAA
jgi:hypothetical protein